MGAALLRKPMKLAKMVNGIVRESPLPVTVKIRTGESERKINADRVVQLLHRAGAAVVSVHGRTMEQRQGAGSRLSACSWCEAYHVHNQHGYHLRSYKTFQIIISLQ